MIVRAHANRVFRLADLLSVGSGDLWSGDDLRAWIADVEGLEAFRAVFAKAARDFRVDHSEV